MYKFLTKRKSGENEVLVYIENKCKPLLITKTNVFNLIERSSLASINSIEGLVKQGTMHDDYKADTIIDFVTSDEKMLQTIINETATEEKIGKNYYKTHKSDIYFNFFKDDIREIENKDFMKLFCLHDNRNTFVYFDEDYIYYFFYSDWIPGRLGKNHIIILKTKTEEYLYKSIIGIYDGYNPYLMNMYYNYINETQINGVTELYRTFYIPKKNSTEKREINEPIESIKEASQLMLIPLTNIFNKRLDSRNETGENAHQFAYMQGLSIYNNALIHKYNKHEISVDIKHFFDNCKWRYVVKYISFLWGTHSVYTDQFAKECYDMMKTVLINPKTNGLYMGNPLSGVISNMIIRPVATYINNILKSYERDKGIVIKFSIYADDITFSTNENLELDSVKKVFNKFNLERIVNNVFNNLDLPFEIKKEKTKQQNNQKRKITGLRINHLNQITVPRKDYYFLGSCLHNLGQGKEISIPLSTLQGKLNFALYVDESGKFLRLINKNMDIINEYGIKIGRKYLEDPYQFEIR